MKNVLTIANEFGTKGNRNSHGDEEEEISLIVLWDK